MGGFHPTHGVRLDPLRVQLLALLRLAHRHSLGSKLVEYLEQTG